MSKTMKVKMLQGAAGPEICLRPGDIHTGETSEMARWCAKGIAEAVKTTRKRAVKPQPETAVLD